MGDIEPVFVIRYYIELVLMIFSLGIQAVALIHCLTQRGEGFHAINTLPKGAWIAILAICMLFTYLISGGLGIFSLIGIGVAMVYLLDIRQGLKDLSDGRGLW